MLFEIQCGQLRERRVEAHTIGQAWRSAVEGRGDMLSALARFRTLLPHRGKWQYITPQALERME